MVCPPIFTLQSLPSSFEVTLGEDMFNRPDNTGTYNERDDETWDLDARAWLDVV
jgi:hypothetical protein